MAVKKYEHLIKPLNIGKMKGGKKPPRQRLFIDKPAYANQKVSLAGKDLEGLNLHFDYGFSNTLGEVHPERDPHVHPYPEVIFQVGLDAANINYLGADMEFCLGEEQETYSFSEPTVIVIPAGLPHGPITTKRIYSPRGIGFYAVGLAPAPEANWLKKPRPTKSTGKYAHLLKPLKSGLLIERGKLNPSRSTPAAAAGQSGQKLGPGNANHLAWFYGKDLEGLNINMDWGFFSRPGLWHRGVGAHSHPAGEVLVFAGIEPDNIDYLGAEIEIDLGKEHERYLINKPSAVVCPPGLPHCPIVTRWVDKPFAFFSINLSREYQTSFLD